MSEDAVDAKEPDDKRTSGSQMNNNGPVGSAPPAPNIPLSRVIKGRLATLAQIGEDWLYLALLGTIMALLSFGMDFVIGMFLNTRLWLYHDLDPDNMVVQYLGWSLMPVVLVTLSTAFVHRCSPTAVGSGIPEMKTILRGVVLNEYLNLRTLVAKVVGLTLTLGSGLPLGKEGPSVHMASIVATQLSKLVASFQGIYENESRTSEMLSAACAVGVAATFYAPIGGVLFSIEVTAVYFAVRNYWRGFFAACCGATIWRMLGFWLKNEESLSALFKTTFPTEFPFDPIELLAFAFIGATCGLGGAAYIKFHRQIVQFFRRHESLSGFLQRNRYVYPVIITLIITSVNFPPLLGQYAASSLNTHTTIEHLFSNRTWSFGSQDLVSKQILDEWTTDSTSFHLHLVIYILMLFWTSALASTIPIPSGIFIPVLKIGAAYGRLMGELMHSFFPEGIKHGENLNPVLIVPGSYAVVGAAAFSGSVTHTISTSVILFEMTGQIVHMIPVILGVLIANAVCQSLQPSIYDSIIEIKKLPYLPPIASSNSISHKILVKDFMSTKLAFVWRDKCPYAHVKALLADHTRIIAFPVVESPKTMRLLGSVPRSDLLKLLFVHLGRERRLQEVIRRNSDVRPPQLTTLKDGSTALAEPGDARPKDGRHSAERAVPGSRRTSQERGPERAKFRVRGSSESSSSTTGSVTGVPQCGDSSPIARLIERFNEGPPSAELEKELSAAVVTQKRRDDLEASKAPPEVRSAASAPHQATRPRRPAGLPMAVFVKPTNRQSLNTPLLASARPRKSILKTSSSNLSMRNVSANCPADLRPSLEPSRVSVISADSTQSTPLQMPSPLLYGSCSARRLGATPTSTTTSTTSPLEGPMVLALGQAELAGASARAARERRPRVRLPDLRVVDMTPEEQTRWEQEQLNSFIDISKCQMDEAPFQFVQQTSLYRVHTLFSMLGLNHAYVTSFGQLVGVVALKDIRYAIEKMLQEK